MSTQPGNLALVRVRLAGDDFKRGGGGGNLRYYYGRVKVLLVLLIDVIVHFTDSRYNNWQIIFWFKSNCDDFILYNYGKSEI